VTLNDRPNDGQPLFQTARRRKRGGSGLLSYAIAFIVAVAILGAVVAGFGLRTLDGKNGISQTVLNAERERGPRKIHGFHEIDPATTKNMTGPDD